MYLREHLLADNLLDDQRHGNDDAWLDLGKSLSDDGRRRRAVQIEHMTAMQEFEQELEGHTIHVSHRKDGDDIVATFDGGTQHVAGKVIV